MILTQFFFIKEYYDYHDARDAIRELDGKKLFGDEKLVIEPTHKNSGERDRDRRRRSSPPGKCYGCGETGHW